MKATETTSSKRAMYSFLFSLLAETRPLVTIKNLKGHDLNVLRTVRGQAQFFYFNALSENSAAGEVNNNLTDPAALDAAALALFPKAKETYLPALSQATILVSLRTLASGSVPKAVGNFASDAEIILRKSLIDMGYTPGKTVADAAGLEEAIGDTKPERAALDAETHLGDDMSEYEGDLTPHEDGTPQGVLSASDAAEGAVHTATEIATGGLGDVPPGVGLPAIQGDALAGSAAHSPIVLSLVTTAPLSAEDTAAAAKEDSEERAAIQAESNAGSDPTPHALTFNNDIVDAQQVTILKKDGTTAVYLNSGADGWMKVLVAPTAPKAPALSVVVSPKKHTAAPAPADADTIGRPQTFGATYPELYKKIAGTGVGRGGFYYAKITRDASKAAVEIAIHFKLGDIDTYRVNAAAPFGWEKVEAPAPKA